MKEKTLKLNNPILLPDLSRVVFQIARDNHIKTRIMKIPVLLVLCVIYFSPCFSQSASEIRNSSEYIYGEGNGENTKIADKSALANLISKISINIKNDFTSREHEIVTNGKNTSVSDVNNLLSTYSSATLTNTNMLILHDEPNAQVMRYIKKNEVDRIFKDRENKIIEMIGNATTSEENLQIDDALRYYYWAYMLVQSLRYPNEVKYTDKKGAEHQLYAWIPYKLSEILNGLSVTLQNANDKALILLNFTYNNKPVRSLDFTYFDGQDWSTICSVKDGIGTVELDQDNKLSTIQIKYEYEYEGQTHIDKELDGIFNLVKGCNISKKAYAKIALNKRIHHEESRQLVNTDSTIGKDSLNQDSSFDVSQLSNITTLVISSIQKRQYDHVRQYFTDDGYSSFNKLIKYGQARIIDTGHFSFSKLNEEIFCHNIPMSFSFQNNSRQFIEDICLTFNKENKIDNISFGLGKEATNDIMRNQMWSEDARKTLIDFLENYKTAYALKRLDYLSQIFADNALIITGHIVMEATKTNDEYKLNKKVIHNRQSKNEYLHNLKMVFNSNEFINLRFTNNNIRKAATGGEIYGIQIKQDYYSSHYGDSGYLFLLVDVNDPKKPLIHVRTWEEQPSSEGIIGIEDF